MEARFQAVYFVPAIPESIFTLRRRSLHDAFTHAGSVPPCEVAAVRIALMAFLLVTTATAVRTKKPRCLPLPTPKSSPQRAPDREGHDRDSQRHYRSCGRERRSRRRAVIDATGLTVYPGLIDAFSDIGLEEAAPARPAARRRLRTGARRRQPATQPAGSPDERQGLTPYRQAFELINPANRKIELPARPASPRRWSCRAGVSSLDKARW